MCPDSRVCSRLLTTFSIIDKSQLVLVRPSSIVIGSTVLGPRCWLGKLNEPVGSFTDSDLSIPPSTFFT